jgi:hypothetical protein
MTQINWNPRPEKSPWNASTGRQDGKEQFADIKKVKRFFDSRAVFVVIAFLVCSVVGVGRRKSQSQLFRQFWSYYRLCCGKRRRRGTQASNSCQQRQAASSRSFFTSLFRFSSVLGGGGGFGASNGSTGKLRPLCDPIGTFRTREEETDFEVASFPTTNKHVIVTTQTSS